MYKYMISITICIMPLQGFAAGHLSTLDLLDKYSETQDRLQPFIIKSEDSITNHSSFGKAETGRSYSSSELCFDGNRSSLRNRLWGDLMQRDIVPEDKPEYQSFLWDGKDFFQYSKSPRSTARPHGMLNIDHSSKYSEKMISRGYSGASLFGFSYGDDARIDSVLCKADIIDVEDKLEPVAGSLCYVINATTPYGKYRVWLDPEHGYNIAKMEVKKDTDDLMFGQIMRGKAKFSGSVKNVRFEKISELWVPMEADIEISRTLPNSMFYQSAWHHKRTEVTLNPDFDSLGVFTPHDVENGAEVLVLDVAGISYTWQDGKLVPNVDELAIEQLDKMTDEIMRQDRANDANNSMKALQCMLSSANVTVAELLAKYKLSQQQMQSFTAKAETTIVDTASASKTSPMREKCDFACDGKRVSHRSSIASDLAGTTEQQQYTSFVWDGKRLIQYRGGSAGQSGQVYITMNDSRTNEIISTQYKGAALLGFCNGDYERIDSILDKAQSISIRKGTVRQGESICYVIDATTERGKYSVWLDAAHGYNIAEIQVHRKPGDVIRNAGRAKTDMTFSLINVRFENIKGVWFPAEADIQMTEDNNSQTTKWHHKRVEISLNPNHEKLGSFSADAIPDGTNVTISGHYGDKLKWQNGKVLTEDGKTHGF